MIKRTVEISSKKVYVYTRQKQLKIDFEDKPGGTIPCEDIGLLVLDSPALTCTQSALVAMAENGGAIMVCGKDHHPTALFLPLVANTTMTERLIAQVEAGKPVKKNLWAQIIKAKIENQCVVLPEGTSEKKRLSEIAKSVRSGDPENLEGQAARIYWQALFPGIRFKRSREGPPPNALLNYGYMILRAAIARAICGSGLHPALGLHHKSKYNPFCLADDLMEPYRPFVDQKVRELLDEGLTEIDKESKSALLSLLGLPIAMGKETGPMMAAFAKTTASLAKCYAGKAKKLKLPQL